MNSNKDKQYKTYICIVCGWVYDESQGFDSFAPGTKWEDIPDDFTCPLCGVEKSFFEMILI
jgi:rubredoxin-NAD+ reductase